MKQLTIEAVDPLARAKAWREDNPAAYAMVVQWAEQDASFGCKCSIDLYVNLLRRPHFARKLGLMRTNEVYLFDNDLRAELARLVLYDHPHLPFEIRRSKADGPGAVNTRGRRNRCNGSDAQGPKTGGTAHD